MGGGGGAYTVYDTLVITLLRIIQVNTKELVDCICFELLSTVVSIYILLMACVFIQFKHKVILRNR